MEIFRHAYALSGSTLVSFNSARTWLMKMK